MGEDNIISSTYVGLTRGYKSRESERDRVSRVTTVLISKHGVKMCLYVCDKSQLRKHEGKYTEILQ